MPLPVPYTNEEFTRVLAEVYDGRTYYEALERTGLDADRAERNMDNVDVRHLVVMLSISKHAYQAREWRERLKMLETPWRRVSGY